MKKSAIILCMILAILFTGCEHGEDHLKTIKGTVVQINTDRGQQTVIIEDGNGYRIDISSCLGNSSDWLIVATGDTVYVEYYLADDDWNALLNTATIFRIIGG